jgi:polar amino acid transport system substrate-binding protein
MKFKCLVVLLIGACVTLPSFAGAPASFYEEGPPVQTPETVLVAIKPSEPWVMYDATKPPSERRPVGFSIDLWNAIAKEINVKTEWVYKKTVPEVLEALQIGEADVGIGSITILREREQIVNFSTSMFEIGLQIMVQADAGVNQPLKVVLKEVGKIVTFQNFMTFLLLAFIIANLRWLADRWGTKNEKIFHPSYWRGVYQAFWWSVTMFFTWDTPPSKGLTKTLELSWFLVGMVTISTLTGIIAAALTVQAVGGTIQTEKDLPGKLVAAVDSAAPKAYLERIGARVVPVEDLTQGVNLLLAGKVQALVHDGPQLLYRAKQINGNEEKKVLVLPQTFNHQNYGIAFPPDSSYVKPVNLALLKLREPEGLEDSYFEKLKRKWIPQEE